LQQFHITALPHQYTGDDMSELVPPTARKQHTETRLHGVTLTDDYAWLRDKENPEVTAYLKAENDYAESDTASLADLREQLYREMLSHIKQTDVSVPFRDGDWWYFTRTEEGKQYAIYCRRPVAAPSAGARAPGLDSQTWETIASNPVDAPGAEVILDGNILAEGHAFFAIGETSITDDGRWLAYTTDTTGFRQYTLHLKDLVTGETLPGTVERVGSVVWAADARDRSPSLG
jgi:oligopeptidase B